MTASHDRPHVEKGDGVIVTEYLEVQEKRDAHNNPYFAAEIPYSSREKKKAPFMIFDAIVGVYVGMKYIPTNKAKHGVVNSALHGFFFNDREVFIDPRYIKVVARFADSIG
jgi:hypothetical protein